MTLDRQVKTLIRKATGDFQTAVEVIDTVLPVISREVTSDEYAIEIAAHAIRLGQELKVYLEGSRTEKQAILDQLHEDEAILRTAKYQLEHANTLLGEMSLANMLCSASKDDIRKAVIEAVRMGDKEKILGGMREGIEEVIKPV
jgi:hypothetical protein